MSITVTDILKLPCLKEARVIAGERGLNKALSSVSVLEFTDPNALQMELFCNNEFYGSEIVITAFSSIANNVDQQCVNVQRLAEAGEVGLIIYYVGIIMPRVDQQLIDLADELDFVLIVMPENRMDLRYSEVICEVMEAIFKDQASGISLVTDVLDQMCRLQEHQRTVDTVLRMARDRTRASLILADSDSRVLGQANWPLSLSLELGELPELERMDSCRVSGERTVWRCPLEPKKSKTMELYLVKDGEPLSGDLVAQVAELIRLAINLWSSNHAEIQISELVRAILQDEPLKMRRLADLFHIDVKSIHTMWVLRCEGGQPERFEREGLMCVRKELSHQCSTAVVDVYNGYIVAFIAWPHKMDMASQLGTALIEHLADKGLQATLTRCYQLENTADVRRAFLLNHDHLDDARRIWPTKQIFTLGEIEFAGYCRVTVAANEASLARSLRPLNALGLGDNGKELKQTLAVYLLDAESSVSRCASLLFLHKNTIKYRLERINISLEYQVDKMPEKFDLYSAVALMRLTSENP